jgi:hypothetical protein
MFQGAETAPIAIDGEPSGHEQWQRIERHVLVDTADRSSIVERP